MCEWVVKTACMLYRNHVMSVITNLGFEQRKIEADFVGLDLELEKRTVD